MSTSSRSTESTTTTAPAALFPDDCPKCGNTAAWHGVIVEPGEPDRYACDECGCSMSVEVTAGGNSVPTSALTTEPLLEVVITSGTLFVDVLGRPVLAFCPGAFLMVGSVEVIGGREAERREQLWLKTRVRAGAAPATPARDGAES